MTASDPVRRPPRLRRGPLTIGAPSAQFPPRLATVEPYRPDTIADGGTVLGLTVRAASVRGLVKRYAGGPRQDDLCLAVHEAGGTLLVAVADGVSLAGRSEMGAALAVRYATAAMARQLDAGPDSLDWPGVVGQVAWGLVEEHRRFSGDPEAGPDAASGELATTLVVAAITGRRVQLAAVGDSPAMLLSAGRYAELAPGDAPADGLLGAAVGALPRATGAVRAAEATLTPGSVLLLMTDGLSTPLARGESEVGRVLARELLRIPDALDFARLLDFSRATYDDDRTLVAVWAPDDGD